MARTGNFGGFAFDEEVFTGMMQEADYWTTPIIASGIVQQDSSIMDLIGEHGNVATIPIYKPIDANESGMEQSLPTAKKYLAEDVRIKEIPFFEVSNLEGGYTVFIGKEL